MDNPVIAVYDANVLYPAPLRDLLIRLAQAGLVHARWTETIHDEWIRNVLANNQHVTAERLARTRSLMNEAVGDCLVTGYEDLIDALKLPDPDDRHVLATTHALQHRRLGLQCSDREKASGIGNTNQNSQIFDSRPQFCPH